MKWKHLYNVPKEHNFKLKNGREIKNLHGLSKHLSTIDEDTFSHHVNEEKNDFMNWVDDIINDPKLAKKIAKAANQEKMAKVVHKRVTELEKERRHHENVLDSGIRWGVKEFSYGLIAGLFIGFVILRALGQI
jgi:hypothetical protein